MEPHWLFCSPNNGKQQQYPLCLFSIIFFLFLLFIPKSIYHITNNHLFNLPRGINLVAYSFIKVILPELFVRTQYPFPGSIISSFE